MGMVEELCLKGKEDMGFEFEKRECWWVGGKPQAGHFALCRRAGAIWCPFPSLLETVQRVGWWPATWLSFERSQWTWPHGHMGHHTLLFQLTESPWSKMLLVPTSAAHIIPKMLLIGKELSTLVQISKGQESLEGIIFSPSTNWKILTKAYIIA